MILKTSLFSSIFYTSIFHHDNKELITYVPQRGDDNNPCWSGLENLGQKQHREQEVSQVVHTEHCLETVFCLSLRAQGYTCNEINCLMKLIKCLC